MASADKVLLQLHVVRDVLATVRESHHWEFHCSQQCNKLERELEGLYVQLARIEQMKYIRHHDRPRFIMFNMCQLDIHTKAARQRSLMSIV